MTYKNNEPAPEKQGDRFIVLRTDCGISRWSKVNRILYWRSELVQLKLNIETSVGESTPTEAEYGGPLPLVEVGVSRLDDVS